LFTELLAYYERQREDCRTALDQMTEDVSEADLYAGTPEDYAMALKRAPAGRAPPDDTALHGATGLVPCSPLRLGH
jgi:hypothetical protein